METWARWYPPLILVCKRSFSRVCPLHSCGIGNGSQAVMETASMSLTPFKVHNLAIMEIIHEVLKDLKIDVRFLNITQLSEYRKDVDTTVFGERRGKLLTKEQRADPMNFADCIHWCLPGVPDTWNEIRRTWTSKAITGL